MRVPGKSCDSDARVEGCSRDGWLGSGKQCWRLRVGLFEDSSGGSHGGPQDQPFGMCLVIVLGYVSYDEFECLTCRH